MIDNDKLKELSEMPLGEVVRLQADGKTRFEDEAVCTTDTIASIASELLERREFEQSMEFFVTNGDGNARLR